MGNPIPTKIKFNDFFKVIEIIALRKFAKCIFIPKSGSKRRIEIFAKNEDTLPCIFWVVHEDKTVWSGDLKKACINLGVSKKDFEKELNSL